MRTLFIALLLAAGCSKTEPPAPSGKPMVRVAISAAAASANKPPPDAGN